MWPRAEQHAREKTWPALVAPHKMPDVPGGEEEALACRSDRPQPTRTTTLATPQFIDPADRRDWGRPLEAAREPPHCRVRLPSWSSADFQPIVGEADDHPCLVAPASRWVTGPLSMRRPSSGGTNSAILAQAVPPTATAPIAAKVTRQPSDGMPIWAKPSVPL